MLNELEKQMGSNAKHVINNLQFLDKLNEAASLTGKISEMETISSDHQNQEASLQEYKNVHKKLYDLPFFNGGDAADNFRTALYWERGFELAFEGQRKYDLLRWGILAETLQLFQSKMDKSLKGKYVAGDNFVKGKHELFPIPLGELQANPALNNQNNPGYE